VDMAAAMEALAVREADRRVVGLLSGSRLVSQAG